MRTITESIENEELNITKEFTDREEPRDLFWESFEKLRSTGDIQVVSYTGLGGIGKSEILRKLQQEVAERSPKSKMQFVDFERTVEFNHDTLDIFKLIKTNLEDNYKFKFPIFDLVAYTYDVKMGKPASRKELDTILDNHPTLKIISKAAGVIGIFSPINGIAEGAKMILGKAGEIIDGVDNAQGIAHNLSKIFCSKEFSEHASLIDKSTPEELKRDLSYYFAIDLANNMKKETAPFVFFIDTFEKLVNEFDENDATSKDLWLRGRTGLILRVPNVIWVIAGREKLTWKKDEDKKLASHLISRSEYLNWSEALAEYDLSAFKPSDAEKYLRAADISDPNLISGIIEYTRGNPYHLSLCVDMYHRIIPERQPVLKDFEGGDDVLADRLLRYTSKDERDFITMLAFQANWTDENIGEISKRYVGTYHASLYETIKHMSFVVKENGTYKIHDNAKYIIVSNASPAVRRQFESARAAEVEEKLSQAVVNHTIATATEPAPEMVKTPGSAAKTPHESKKPSAVSTPTKPGSTQQAAKPGSVQQAANPTPKPTVSTTAPKETFAQTLEFMYSELSSATDHATFSSRAFDFIKQIRVYQETFDEVYRFRYHDIDNFKGTFEYRCVTTLAFASQNVGGLAHIPSIAKQVSSPSEKTLFIETLKIAAFIVGFDSFDDVKAGRCTFIKPTMKLIETYLGTKDFYYWYVYRNFLCFDDNNFIIDYFNFRSEKPIYNKFFLALDMAFLSDCAEQKLSFWFTQDIRDIYINKGIKNLKILLTDSIIECYDFKETKYGLHATPKAGLLENHTEITPHLKQIDKRLPRNFMESVILPEIEKIGGSTKVALMYFAEFVKNHTSDITRCRILDVADASLPLFLTTSDMDIFNAFFKIYSAIPGLNQKQTTSRIEDFYKLAIERSTELFGEDNLTTLLLKGYYYPAIAPSNLTPHINDYLRLRDKFGAAHDCTLTQLITIYRIINSAFEKRVITGALPSVSRKNNTYNIVKERCEKADFTNKFKLLEPYYFDFIKHRNETKRTTSAVRALLREITAYPLGINYDLLIPEYSDYALDVVKTTLKLTHDCFDGSNATYYDAYNFVFEYLAQQTFQNNEYSISPTEFLARTEPIEDFDFYLSHFSNEKFVNSAKKSPKNDYYYHFIMSIDVIITRYLIADELTALNTYDEEFEKLREICCSFGQKSATVDAYFKEHPELSGIDCYKLILVWYYVSSIAEVSRLLFSDYLDSPQTNTIFDLLKIRSYFNKKSLVNEPTKSIPRATLMANENSIKNPRALKYLIFLEKILDTLYPPENA